MRQLSEFGANANIQDDAGRTALFDPCDNGRAEVVGLLLSVGADPKIADKSADTPLHKAACGRDPDIVRVLVENGADLNAKNWRGRTPLDEATLAGFADQARLLLELGADPGAKDRERVLGEAHSAHGERQAATEQMQNMLQNLFGAKISFPGMEDAE